MLTDIQKQELSRGIGASECGAVLGIDPYTTPYELWLRKTGKHVEDLSQNEAIIMGHLLEPVIAKRYSQLTNQKVARVNKAFFHPDYPMLCHIDRKIVKQRKIVEIKTANPFTRDWGEAGTDEVPMRYIAQVQHQLAVTGYESADLIVFRGTTDLRIYHFSPDSEVINAITSAVKNFWDEYVIKDIPPPATTRSDLLHMFPTNNGNFIEPDDSIIDTLDRIKLLKAQINDLEKTKTQEEKELLEFIADNDGLAVGDNVLCTYRANKNGTRILRINK